MELMKTPIFIDSDIDRKKNILDFYLKGMKGISKFKYINGEYIYATFNTVITMFPSVSTINPTIEHDEEIGMDIQYFDVVVDGVEIHIDSMLPKQIKVFRFDTYVNYDDLETKFHFNGDGIPIFEYGKEDYLTHKGLRSKMQKDIQSYLSLFIFEE
jgi:hypothetical protein